MKVLVVALVLALSVGTSRAADRTFPGGSLIIPMDLAYQDTGLLQAYGLLYQLLRNGIKVSWVIDPAKTYHAAACDTAGDLCAWDCAVEGSGVKCPYPTSSPDFAATTKVVWSDRGVAPDTVIGTHRYRGGPFVIDAADRAAALLIINAWNDPALWAANPWANRSVSHVVTVHETTAAFTGNVTKEMLAAPTIAVFSDGNEDIATGYLRAAGIPQSSGVEFPASKCGNNDCGPGTVNPDMLTSESIMGDLGTCGAPNANHKNGSLFRPDGLPAYCQIMSMHWGVNDREKVECGGGRCPATQAACAANTPFTYHGHEVVAEVRQFLQYPVHFYAECQAVNAYENTVPNPAWPYLDDAGRDGHFLTTTGTPPACPCTAPGFTCVNNVCIPQDVKEQGAGFLIEPQPAAATLKVLRPDVPYNQFDGAFDTVGGSEPAYNLSTYLGTMYKNNRQVTLITGPAGPGAADVWMSGYLDGECDIGPILGPPPPGAKHATCNAGKISYLGGHKYETGVPVAGLSDVQGTRLFLNALFEADCVTAEGQPALSLGLTPVVIPAQSVPVDHDVVATYANLANGAALDATMTETMPAGVTVVAAASGTMTATTASWTLGSISGVPLRAGDPPDAGSRTSTLQFADFADYTIVLEVTYKIGTSTFTTTQPVTVSVQLDTDGDGVPDDVDPDPNNPNICGDSDLDGCDDCPNGTFDPANDGCDPGNPNNGDPGGCCSTNDGPAGPLALTGLMFGIAAWTRRRRRGRA